MLLRSSAVRLRSMDSDHRLSPWQQQLLTNIHPQPSTTTTYAASTLATVIYFQRYTLEATVDPHDNTGMRPLAAAAAVMMHIVAPGSMDVFHSSCLLTCIRISMPLSSVIRSLQAGCAVNRATATAAFLRTGTLSSPAAFKASISTSHAPAFNSA